VFTFYRVYIVKLQILFLGINFVMYNPTLITRYQREHPGKTSSPYTQQIGLPSLCENRNQYRWISTSQTLNTSYLQCIIYIDLTNESIILALPPLQQSIGGSIKLKISSTSTSHNLYIETNSSSDTFKALNISGYIDSNNTEYVISSPSVGAVINVEGTSKCWNIDYIDSKKEIFQIDCSNISSYQLTLTQHLNQICELINLRYITGSIFTLYFPDPTTTIYNGKFRILSPNSTHSISTQISFAVSGAVSEVDYFEGAIMTTLNEFTLVSRTGSGSTPGPVSSITYTSGSVSDMFDLEFEVLDNAMYHVTGYLVSTASDLTEPPILDGFMTEAGGGGKGVYLPLAGGTMTGNILPNVSNSLSIGGPTLTFDAIYSTYFIGTNSTQVELNCALYQTSDGNTFLNSSLSKAIGLKIGDINFAQYFQHGVLNLYEFSPTTDLTLNLGSSSNRFNDIYGYEAFLTLLQMSGNIDLGNNLITGLGTSSGTSTDAVNVTYLNNTVANYLPLTGGTLSGTLNLGSGSTYNLISYVANPISLQDAVNLTYLQSNYSTTSTISATYLPLAGGTLTGNLLVNTSSVNIGSSGTPFGNIYGTIATASQTNITSVGTLSSLTMGGNIALGSNLITGLRTTSGTSTDAVNVSYLNSKVANYLPLAGGTMSGSISLNSDATYSLGSSSNKYLSIYTGVITATVGATINEVAIAGSGMNMGGLKITNLPTSTGTGSDAVNVTYLNNKVALYLPLAGGTLSGNLLANSSSINIGSSGTPFGNIYGTIATAAQGNITSVGTLSSLTMGGNIALGANLITGLGTTSGTSTDAVNVTYLNSIVANYLLLTGGTLSGTLNLGSGTTYNLISYVANPISLNDAVNLTYLQSNYSTTSTISSTYLPLVGGTLSGTLNLGSGTTYNLISYVANPISLNDAVNLTYLQSNYSTSSTIGSTYLPLAGGTLTGNLLANTSSVNIGSSGTPFGNIYGTIATAAQANITSVGTLTSLTMGGNIALGTHLITGLGTTSGTSTDAVNVTYLNSTVANYLLLTGGTLSGTLNLGSGTTYNLISYVANPISLHDAVNLTYLQSNYSTTSTINSTYLPLVGGTLSGTLNLGSGTTYNLISYVANPISLHDAVNLTYLQSNYSTTSTIGSTYLPLAGGTLTGNLLANTSSVNIGSSGTPFGNIYGTIATAAQANITSVGTLTSLTMGGNIALGTHLITGLGTTSGTSTDAVNVSYLTSKLTAYLPIAGGALTGSVIALFPTVNLGSSGSPFGSIYGTIATAAQTSITSLGTLTSLTMGGNIALGGNLITGLGTSSGTTTDAVNVSYLNTKVALYLPLTGGTLSGALNMGTGTTYNLISYVANPVSNNDAVNLTYLQSNYSSTSTISSTYLPKAGGTMSGNLLASSSSVNIGSSGTPFGSIYGTIATATQASITSIGPTSTSTGVTIPGVLFVQGGYTYGATICNTGTHVYFELTNSFYGTQYGSIDISTTAAGFSSVGAIFINPSGSTSFIFQSGTMVGSSNGSGSLGTTTTRLASVYSNNIYVTNSISVNGVANINGSNKGIILDGWPVVGSFDGASAYFGHVTVLYTAHYLYYYAMVQGNNGTTYINSYNSTVGNAVLYFQINGVNQMQMTNVYFAPSASGGLTLGTASLLWGQIYSTSSSITVSDANAKTNITPLNKSKYLAFIRAITPVSYSLLQPPVSGDGVYWGFIAQDVQTVIANLNLGDENLVITEPAVTTTSTPNLDSDGNPILQPNGDPDVTVTQTPILDSNGNATYCYFLRYAELFAPIVASIQALPDSLIPSIDSQLDIGSSTFRYQNLYLSGSVISTSDYRSKKEIKQLETLTSTKFINELKPKSFIMKNDTTETVRHGFIAQDVKETMSQLNIKGIVSEDSEKLGINYLDIIAHLVNSVKHLTSEIESLKKMIK